MTPPNFGALGQYVRVTRQGERRKERMVEPENVVEIEDVTTSKTDSLNPMRVEEETSTMVQGEVGKSFGTRNGITNPNPETSTKPNEMTSQQQGRDEEGVWVEDITNQSESKGEEDDT
jgi:hypothetical protein